MVSFITTLCLPVWHARKHMKSEKHTHYQTWSKIQKILRYVKFNVSDHCGRTLDPKQLEASLEYFLLEPFDFLNSFLPCQLNCQIVYLGSFDVSVWQYNGAFPTIYFGKEQDSFWGVSLKISKSKFYRGLKRIRLIRFLDKKGFLINHHLRALLWTRLFFAAKKFQKPYEPILF